jgi:hypothetical protein
MSRKSSWSECFETKPKKKKARLFSGRASVSSSQLERDLFFLGRKPKK